MRFTSSLKKNEDFRKVYRARISKADKRFVLYINKNNLCENRLGISVSKKVGNSVVRHRIKRLVKEAYRSLEEGCHRGYDLVFIAREDANGASYVETFSSIEHLLKLHKILKIEKS